MSQSNLLAVWFRPCRGLAGLPCSTFHPEVGVCYEFTTYIDAFAYLDLISNRLSLRLALIARVTFKATYIVGKFALPLTQPSDIYHDRERTL